MKPDSINIEDFDYNLPEEQIAQEPVPVRDKSRLLVFRDNQITDDQFNNITDYIPGGSLLVFNNSRVIKARLLFGKESGARIEILCIEPLNPSDYESAFNATHEAEWNCIIGNLKKWKKGPLSLCFKINGEESKLIAEKVCSEGETWRVRFRWEPANARFEEVLNAAGHMPLPPYISRMDVKADESDYQTVYSSIIGSVAAPTAGLHFTKNVLDTLDIKKIKKEEITLHVGAGTFKPVKTSNAAEHEMHCEHFVVKRETIEQLISMKGQIIAVGTTSVRTIETLYWLGVRLIEKPENISFSLGQWEPYEITTHITENESLMAILDYMKEKKLLSLHASTSIMIIPGYIFRLTNGIITNFHQPRSTLLLLIAAWIGEKWKEIYNYAIENHFRFLSYGDSSILFRT